MQLDLEAEAKEMPLGLLNGESGWRDEELVGFWDLRNGLPPDLCHDGALPSEVLEAKAQEAVNHESWRGKGRHDQQGRWRFRWGVKVITF